MKQSCDHIGASLFSLLKLFSSGPLGVRVYVPKENLGLAILVENFSGYSCGMIFTHWNKNKSNYFYFSDWFGCRTRSRDFYNMGEFYIWES